MRQLYRGTIVAAILILSTFAATAVVASNGPVWP